MNTSLHALRVPAAFADDPLVAELAEELACRWERGDQVLAEDLLDRHAELRRAPQRAIGLIYEEICQRQEHHAFISAAELSLDLPLVFDATARSKLPHAVYSRSRRDKFPKCGQSSREYCRPAASSLNRSG